MGLPAAAELCWKNESMELTLTTELISGMTGTRTVGAKRMMRRVVAPEAVAKSTITRLTPRALRVISVVRVS
jgi:hypothetical protein